MSATLLVPLGLEHVLSIDAEVMHGDLCFTGTRVPLTVLLDNLAEEMGVEEFLTHYPSISRISVEAVVLSLSSVIREDAGLQIKSESVEIAKRFCESEKLEEV